MNADTGPIPNWSPRGALPPVPSGTAAPFNRSPYPVSLTDFVLRFGNTEPRREIVSGFLEFRGALQTIGLVKGFQWIDGDLSPADDDAAKAQLDAMLNERGQP